MLQMKPVPYVEATVHIDNLAFYPENPRIYSRFAGEVDRTQAKVQKTLEDMEHVKSLRMRIDRDGQVNEPLFCTAINSSSTLHGQYEYQVLEGNSRLAALKMHKRGSIPVVTSVPCRILDFSAYSERDTETLIFALLGELHITGKTDWNSYENAAYIHRRHKNQGVPLDEIAKEIGKTPRTVQTMVTAFETMLDADDQKQDHWSYYEVLVSNTRIRDVRVNDPNVHEGLVALIKDEKLPSAQKMRESLADILKNKRARRKLLDEDDPFAEALALAEMSGDTNKTRKQLERFHKYLGEAPTKQQIRSLLRSDSTRGATEYELKQITKIIERLMKRA